MYNNNSQLITIKANYVGYLQGAYVFHLENDDIIDFDIIKTSLLGKFDLRSDALKNKLVEITYSEILDDLEEDVIVLFKLEDLKLL